MAVGPNDKIFIIFDQNSEVISSCVQDIMEATLPYDLTIASMELNQWDRTINRKHTKYDRVVFFVSMETERLHEILVNNLDKYANSWLLMLLTFKTDKHSNSNGDDFEHYVTTTIDIIKILWNSCTHKEIRQIGEIKIKNREKGISQCLEESWWPYILWFLSGYTKTSNQKNSNAELFFHIDPENEHEFQWYEEQKIFFEYELGIRCSVNYYNEVDEYIKTCKCVVIYVSAATVVNKKLNHEQKDALELIRGLSPRLRMYVEKLNDSFINMLTKRYELRKYGQGMVDHWMGLLYDLGIVRLRRRQDFMFYSPNAKYRNYRCFYGKVPDPEILVEKNKSKSQSSSRRNSRNLENSRPSSILASTSESVKSRLDSRGSGKTHPKPRMSISSTRDESIDTVSLAKDDNTWSLSSTGVVSRAQSRRMSQSRGIDSRRPVMSPRVSITSQASIHEYSGASRLESVPETPDSLPISRRVSVASCFFDNSQGIVRLDSIDGLIVEDELSETGGLDDVDGYVPIRQTSVEKSINISKADSDFTDSQRSESPSSKDMDQNRPERSENTRGACFMLQIHYKEQFV